MNVKRVWFFAYFKELNKVVFESNGEYLCLQSIHYDHKFLLKMML